MDLFKLNGDVALVTGAGSGIGQAIAIGLAEAGADVACFGHASKGGLDETAHRITALGRKALALTGTVTSQSDLAAAIDRVESELGALTVAVNNAGIAGPTGGVDEIDPSDWRRCIDICLTGQFLCARRAVPLIKAAGGGSIVSMSSAAGRHGYAFRTPYSAAKFGVIGFTQSLAKELGPHAIRVNAILPGIIEGPRIEGVISARAKQVGISHEEMTGRYLQNISLRRMTSPYDVASMVAFLLSDAGINISGQSLGVDGNVETL
ncbi:SDR family oxidoreductase [Mesorhizobium sp. M7A.F.Ca.ET.027.03.2.1]|uniref:SDR family oxidoreductase n=1 Tax=Mesorhizobium sp. M7A.F.Ca.ET.027.03.2.1 TaxID=2496656 RepID=UPI000FCC8811|nr:SDR family oxidoreductase [Mesorhizobium sp. M7A.F.Ca.ET.027.03.2.1]RVD48560.1 SDR family oxidoreductase [Mesorhizobium sp. M7A.F.Ca.ET.027.03.2.1]